MRSKTRFILVFVLAFFVSILLNSCGTSKKVIENITFEDKTVVYTGDTQVVEIKGELPKGVFVSYENNYKKDVGEYLVTAKFSGESEEYEIPEPMTAKLIIIPAKYGHIKFESKEFVYDGLPHSLTAEGLPQGVYAKYTNNDQINVGEYTVTVKFTGAIKNYEIPETMTATLTIKSQPVTVKFESKEVVYDGMSHSLMVENLPYGVYAEYTNNRQIEVGEYKVTATFKGDIKNYDLPKSMTATLKIVEYNIDNIKLENQEFVYDGNEHALVITGALPRGVEVTYTNHIQANAGIYEVTAKFTDTTGNYEVPEPMKATLTILKKELEITIEDYEVTYDGNEYSLTVKELLPEGVKVSYENNNQVNAGTYKVTATFVDTTGNYVINSVEGTLTILKQELEITLEDYEIIYDGNEHPLEIKELLPEGITVSYENNNQVNAGEHKVVAKIVDETGNYSFTESIEAILTILPQDLTIEFNDEFPYDGEVHSVSLKEELPEGITVEFENNEHTEVGKYDVIVKVNNANVNYNIQDEIKVVLKINPLEITGIEFSDAYLDYTGETLSLSIEGELPKGVNVIYEGNDKKYPGTYYVVATFVDTTGHYIVPEPMKAMLQINTSVNYEILDGEITITGDRSMNNNVIIPEQIKIDEQSYIVTSIAKRAFKDSIHVSNVTLPNTLKVINSYAFEGSNLSEIVIPNSVNTIDDYAFRNCKHLLKVYIPLNVTDIGNQILDGCLSLSELTIPRVNQLGQYFGHTTSSVSDLPGFYRASSFNAGRVYVYYIPNELTNVTVLGGEIFAGAFYKCKGIKEIILPNNIIEVQESAFEDCEALNHLIIPASISIVGEKAFKGCSSLTTIYNNSNLNIEIGQETNGYLGYYATIVYNKGEWEYVDGIPTPKEESIE